MRRGHTYGSSAESPQLLHGCATHRQPPLPQDEHLIDNKGWKNEHCKKNPTDYKFRAQEKSSGMEGRILGARGALMALV